MGIKWLELLESVPVDLRKPEKKDADESSFEKTKISGKQVINLSQTPESLLDILSCDGETTTQLRREFKSQLTNRDGDYLVSFFISAFNRSFKRRDHHPSVRQITQTHYLKPLVFTLPFPEPKKAKVKIRLRKYFEIHSDEPEQMYPSGGTAGRSYFELKIDHPLLEKVVIKRRFLIDDKIVEMLVNLPFSQCVETLKNLHGESTDDDARKILKLFIDLKDCKEMEMESLIGIRYERNAYRVKLKASDAAEPVDVQMTFDRDVTYFDPMSEKVCFKRGSNVSVVEMKVPLCFAAFNPDDLKKITGLKYIQWATFFMSQHRLQDAPEGKGKLSFFENRSSFKKID